MTSSGLIKSAVFFAEESYRRLLMLIMIPIFKLANLFNGSSPRRNTWLIGENRGEAVRENGCVYFKYCRESHPHIDVYFVARKPSLSHLARDECAYGVQFGSVKHARIFASTNVGYYTHTTRDLMYASSFHIFGRGMKLVYLHHGVLGFKKFNKDYMKFKNAMDLFVVGSEMERKIAVEQIGVDSSRVRVTGYPRFDNLLDNSIGKPLKIVYMPTHRNYLRSSSDVEAFIEKINSFINNTDFMELLKTENAKLEVFLHISLQRYSALLTPQNSLVKISSVESTNPGKLISESNLMITDYSSVAWDFIYLNKPVIFYRFDLEEYTRDRSSYVDLRRDLIGPVIADEEGVIRCIEGYIASGCRIAPQHSAYRDSIMPPIDLENCDRVFAEVDARLKHV